MGLLLFPAVTPAASTEALRLLVVDAATGQPLPGVKIRGWARAQPTGPDGATLIPMPPADTVETGFRLTLSKSGYVNEYVTWSKEHGDSIHDIPTRFTATMEKGVTIGGVVTDDRRHPVTNAVVMLSGPPPRDPSARLRTIIDVDFHSEATDAAGRWSYDKAPRDLSNLTLHVSCPGVYAPADFVCADKPRGDATILRAADLLSGKALLTLGHGIVLGGVVMDNSGHPVPHAIVTRNHAWRDPNLTTETDSAGRFVISNLLPVTLFLTVQAHGLAGVSRCLQLTNPTPPLTFVLTPGNVFGGEVLDPNGRPIAGATVQMDRRENEPPEFDWTAKAGSDGRFLWNSAPAGVHPYRFSAPGYHSRLEPALAADGSTHRITLRLKTKGDKALIEGSVTDAESKTPISNFTVRVQTFNGPDVRSLQQAVTNNTGRFTTMVDSDAAAYVISVVAPGRQTQTSPRESPAAGDRTIDFTLRK